MTSVTLFLFDKFVKIWTYIELKHDFSTSNFMYYDPRDGYVPTIISLNYGRKKEKEKDFKCSLWTT